MAVASPAFTGFRPEAIQFLADLKSNNDRAWFQPRKAEYERLLKEPLEALLVTLDERFQKRGIPLRADPAKSPFRIYRDVRFSKDKSPYKTNVGASLPWAGDIADTSGIGSAAATAHASGGYFHLEPGEIFVGGGVWHPDRSWIDAFRQRVASDAAGVHAVVDDPAFVSVFGGVRGESLKRTPQGYPPDHPEAELLKLKDVVFGRSLADSDAMSADLPDLICDSFAVAIPTMRLLATIA